MDRNRGLEDAGFKEHLALCTAPPSIRYKPCLDNAGHLAGMSGNRIRFPEAPLSQERCLLYPETAGRTLIGFCTSMTAS